MHLAVVGTGLMGGSFALAARANGLFSRITGLDPDMACAERARALGIVDQVAESVPEDADAVLLAGPSQTIAPWVVRLAGHRGVVFDTGSVKQAIVDEVVGALGGLPARFVPCHPLAGSEHSGPEAADADLFQEAEVMITPTADTGSAALDQVTAWWQAVGADVRTMSAAEHDRVLAVTSHLPHLLAFSYLHLVNEEHLPHTAGGFRDFTRIGASDAGMWTPIFRMNRAAVLEALDDLQGQLARARRLVEGADEAALETFLRQAARRRGSPVVGAISRSRSGDRSHKEGDRSHKEGDRSHKEGDRSHKEGAPVIAVDGPSGSGKGTLAALVAERLGWHLLDSGALYRIVALVALERGLGLDDAGALAAAARGLALEFREGRTWVDGAERTDDIRTEAVSEASSVVAALQPVRDAVLEVQRAQRRPPGLVADGRDMGTVVFPDAPLKVFLDASAEVRAERRYKQLKNKGLSVSLAALLAGIRERDERDRGRAIAPLRAASDAILIDSTNMSIDEVLEKVLDAADQAHLGKGA